MGGSLKMGCSHVVQQGDAGLRGGGDSVDGEQSQRALGTSSWRDLAGIGKGKGW